MSATSFVTFFLTSADRIILSKVLPLEFFGYYTLGTTLSTGLQSIGSQIMRVLFPDFSALVAKGDEGELRKLYHKSAQLVSVIVLPATIIAILFSVELIQLWTQDVNTTLNTAPIAALLFIGSAINTMLSVPNYLILAYGWTSLGFFTNLISLILIVPLMVVLSLRWGGLGAALTWVILNSGYLLITPRIIHRRILRGELRRWYLTDIGLPLVAILAVAGIGRLLIQATLPVVPSIIAISFVACCTFGVAVLTASEVRNWVFVRAQAFLQK